MLTIQLLAVALSLAVPPTQRAAYAAVAAHFILSEPEPAYCLAVEREPADDAFLTHVLTILTHSGKETPPFRVHSLAACANNPAKDMESTFEIATRKPARWLYLMQFRQVSSSRAAVTLLWNQGPLDGQVLEYRLSFRRGGWHVVSRKLVAVS